MNRKGFTMVELLGAIVILGILMTLGMNTFFRQREKSSRKAYDMMHEGVYSAAEEYYMDSVGDNSDVSVDKLVELDYLDGAADPWDKGGKCTGTVKKCLRNSNKKSGDKIDLYEYVVTLKCSKVTKCLMYPGKNPCPAGNVCPPVNS